MNKIVLFIVCSLLVSCVQNELDDREPSLNKTLKSQLIYRRISDYTGNDSLAIISRIQSDPIIMIMSRVRFDGGSYILDMTKENALELKIDPEIYDECLSYINSIGE